MGIDRVLLRPADISHTDLALMVAFFSIACYNVLEIFVWIFDTFKHPRGLYFWSMQTGSWGIIIHIIFLITGTFGYISKIPAGVGIMIGYYSMLISPLFVLYSRLHLVVANARQIRWVLYLIVTISCILVIVATILFFGALGGVQQFDSSVSACSTALLTCFCAVELFLSGVYIVEAFRGLKPVFAVKGREGRKMLVHLIIVYICVVILIATLLTLDYVHFNFVLMSYNPFVYSIKLKLEFGVLTRLVNLIQSSQCGCHILHPWNSSQDLRLEPSPSISNQLSSPGQGRKMSTSEWSSTHEFHGIARERSHFHSMNGSYISLPLPPPALSSDSLPDSRV